MTMITFKANVMVIVHVHCISMIQKEFHSTVFTNFLFTGVRENKGRGDGVRKEEVMACASNIITLICYEHFFLSMLKSSYCQCTVLTLHFCFILPLKRLNSQLNELLERVGYIPKFPQNDFTVNTFHLNSQLQRRVRILTLTMTVR